MTTSAPAAGKVSQLEAYDIGVDSYCYFYSLLSMELTRLQTTNLPAGQKPGFGPPNQFAHIRAYPDADFRTVVRPNFDTLYSSAWLDVSKEPVILSVPNTAGRYYLLPMLDMWTDVIAAPGWRTSGTDAQTWAVVPPGWSGTVPGDIERIEATTPHMWIIGRIKTDGPDDYQAVHALQDALSITPLSQWNKSSPSTVITAQQVDPAIDMKTPPLDAVNGMSTEAYFARAAELLKTIKPHATDYPILARLKRIGFEVGKSFDLSKMDAALAGEFKRGAQEALKLMVEKLSVTGRRVNGWNMNTDTMGVYGSFYFKRAIVAMAGLGANLPEDAIYPLNVEDADGEPIVGEKKYALHFDKDQLPPVNAFWSVTMYDAAGFQVANPINRFAISSWMNLKKGADGSLDLYIQHQSPGADKESNWLPAPANGRLGVTMRLYAPARAALNGDWNPPAIKKA